ncbi:MAG: hypothetical protein BWZ10_01991 [candidate division BRC1 bacterium ADurb.BinA364]|nr:MAG: hypothetical protein BWZ10_01991 [candidate division BRC1 bacterium ADurb.BinA364]
MERFQEPYFDTEAIFQRRRSVFAHWPPGDRAADGPKRAKPLSQVRSSAQTFRLSAGIRAKSRTGPGPRLEAAGAGFGISADRPAVPDRLFQHAGKPFHLRRRIHCRPQRPDSLLEPIRRYFHHLVLERAGPAWRIPPADDFQLFSQLSNRGLDRRRRSRSDSLPCRQLAAARPGQRAGRLVRPGPVPPPGAGFVRRIGLRPASGPYRSGGRHRRAGRNHGRDRLFSGLGVLAKVARRQHSQGRLGLGCRGGSGRRVRRLQQGKRDHDRGRGPLGTGAMAPHGNQARLRRARLGRPGAQTGPGLCPDRACGGILPGGALRGLGRGGSASGDDGGLHRQSGLQRSHGPARRHGAARAGRLRMDDSLASQSDGRLFVRHAAAVEIVFRTWAANGHRSLPRACGGVRDRLDRVAHRVVRRGGLCLDHGADVQSVFPDRRDQGRAAALFAVVWLLPARRLGLRRLVGQSEGRGEEGCAMLGAGGCLRSRGPSDLCAEFRLARRPVAFPIGAETSAAQRQGAVQLCQRPQRREGAVRQGAGNG